MKRGGQTRALKLLGINPGQALIVSVQHLLVAAPDYGYHLGEGQAGAFEGGSDQEFG